MCRSIQTLFNREPSPDEADVRAAALQFVRKVSGFRHPSRANQAAFERAVDEVAHAAQHLLGRLVTSAPPRPRRAPMVRSRDE